MSVPTDGEGALDTWPPKQWPPVEPQLGSDLTESIDWMTYPHEVLHVMATTRLNLPAAGDVAAEWQSIGDALVSIADELSNGLVTASEGWQGETAELARSTAKKLSAWSESAGLHAHEVGRCVEQHAANVEWARDAMPEPLEPSGTDSAELPIWRNLATGDDQLPGAGGTTAPMSAAHPFTGGPGDAHGLIVDGGAQVEERQQLHRRAAEVMGVLQRNTAATYSAVPGFTSPDIALRAPDPSSFGGRGETAVAAAGSMSVPGEVGVGRAGSGAGAEYPNSGRPPTHGAVPVTEGGGIGARGGGERGLGGARTGFGHGGAATSSSGASAAAGPGTAGMPMGGGAQRDAERDRKAPLYLAGDPDVFTADEVVVEGVIGAERRRIDRE